ncbi:24297_t:CDS:2 [Gigaspora rosea]|nr:24297_t:CDS:2 [Gigaspora rosea]
MSFSQVTNPAHTEHETTDNTIEENNTNSTTESVATTDQGLDQESKSVTESVTESLKTDQASDWQAIWDDNVQAYYYWNTVTNETTWEIPSSISYTEGSYYQCPTNDSTISADQTATATEEYYQYYYAQYGYYPEGYYYGYDTASTDVTAPAEPPNPLESILDKIDTEVKSKLDGTEDSDYNSFLAQHGNEGADYTISARFNSRTGKFQRDPTLTPEKFSSDAKAIRQMSYFFDYERY